MESCSFSSESGGLLGADGNNIICEVIIDIGLQFDGMKRCCYYPDVDMFNKTLIEWHKRSIRFGGIFHTHFSDIASFSDGDIMYIHDIIDVLPQSFGSVYFPIILLPKKEMIPFHIEKRGKEIVLVEEALYIC